MPTQKSTARLSKKPPLSPEELKQIDAYWRAANYLTACQLYLLDNPLLERPLRESDLKQTIVGHWGTCPGQNFIYTLFWGYFARRGRADTRLRQGGEGRARQCRQGADAAVFRDAS